MFCFGKTNNLGKKEEEVVERSRRVLTMVLFWKDQ